MHRIFLYIKVMKEDFLHFVWRFRKLNVSNLKTSDGEEVKILNFGTYNTLAGPDFSNALLIIGTQQWAGTVEMHLNSSGWYAHAHEKDVNYNNVILHVVWEHDVEVFNSQKQKLPTLVLKNYVNVSLQEQYHKLNHYKYKFIPCENELKGIDAFVLDSWMERLYIERLEEKSALITGFLEQSKNNWEAVLFRLLMKNFGGNINGASFLSIADSFDFSVVQKVSHHVLLLESLLFGQAGLLQSDLPSAYELELRKEYRFLKSKFALSDVGVMHPQFFKLRPPNFPTIRLSQIANLFHKHPRLFTDLMDCKSAEEMKRLLQTETSAFWQEHYTFQKSHEKRSKKTTDSFLELMIINTVIPLQLCYQKALGKYANEELIKITLQLSLEKNHIIDGFKKFGITKNTALHSQAMIQLYKQYCTSKKCLQCAVGTKLMRS